MLNKRNELLRTLSLEELSKVEPLTEEALKAAFQRGARERAQATQHRYLFRPDTRFLL